MAFDAIFNILDTPCKCQKKLQNNNLNTACSCHVTYAFQSESTLYSYLNVKELFARSRREIWSLSDCSRTWTQNHLVRKGGGSIWPFVVFPKMYLLVRGWSPGFLWLIIISHIFPENLIEFPQVLQKIWRFYPSILPIFINCLDFSIFTCYRETNDVTYNRWCQRFFTYVCIIVPWLYWY